MDHFKGINERERYDNDLLNQIRKQNEWLEQIAQLLQPKGEIESVIHPTEGVPIDGAGKRQQRQRGGNGTGGSGEQ